MEKNNVKFELHFYDEFACNHIGVIIGELGTKVLTHNNNIVLFATDPGDDVLTYE